MTSKKSIKILILGYHDHTAEGQSLSYYKVLKDAGYNVCHLSLFAGYNKEKEDNIKYYYSFNDKWGPGFLWFRIKRKIFSFFNGVIIKRKYNYFNLSGIYAKNEKSILKKIGFIPDVILLGWVDYFISPKTIRDLYMQTEAKLVITMVDAHILGGGCHYPCDCKQYETGCLNCPAISKNRVAKSLYKDKFNYLKNIPFLLVGNNYDIERAKKVPFLKGKEFVSSIGTPVIPFSLTQKEARRKLCIEDDSFVILCGAASIKDERKGFRFIIDAVKDFCENMIEKTKVKLVITGNGKYDQDNKFRNLSVITPGYINLNLLFTYFYASDVFVSASLDDSGPMMINYSISCGVPVVSFPIGVACDLVLPGRTGYIAETGNAKSLSEGLSFFCQMSSEQRSEYSHNCLTLIDSLKKKPKPFLVELMEKFEKENENCK